MQSKPAHILWHGGLYIPFVQRLMRVQISRNPDTGAPLTSYQKGGYQATRTEGIQKAKIQKQLRNERAMVRLLGTLPLDYSTVELLIE